jgi:DNA-binding NarL/FixJ family response regulator
MPLSVPRAAIPHTRRILLVDDDEMIRILFTEMFWIYSHSEHEVVTAKTLPEAYEIIRHNPPDVLIFGLRLFGKGALRRTEAQSRLQFITDMKRDHRNTKIVLYAEHDEPELRDIAAQAGVDKYIVKGQLTPPEIVALIESV